MPNRSAEDTKREINSSPPQKRLTYAKRGAFIGSVTGLLSTAYIVSSAIGPSQVDHEPIFSLAIMFVCLFAVFVFLVFVMIGEWIGSCFRPEV